MLKLPINFQADIYASSWQTQVKGLINVPITREWRATNNNTLDMKQLGKRPRIRDSLMNLFVFHVYLLSTWNVYISYVDANCVNRFIGDLNRPPSDCTIHALKNENHAAYIRTHARPFPSTNICNSHFWTINVN